MPVWHRDQLRDQRARSAALQRLWRVRVAHVLHLVAVDGDERFEPVFIRRVVDLDDKRAVVNLTLRSRG
jgi:hypothetical protein